MPPATLRIAACALVLASSNSHGEAVGPPDCTFPGVSLPQDAAILAAGTTYGRPLGFQIDRSGNEAGQVDVDVNSPGRPVALILTAQQPTIWNVRWTPGTRILGVFASGYHRQVMAGLEDNVPVLARTHGERGPCGYFYFTEKNLERLAELNPQSRRVFGRDVEMVYPIRDAKVVLGEALVPEAKLVTSDASPPSSYHDRSAPKFRQAGLLDAVERGLLRKASDADAEAWLAEVEGASTAPRDAPPVAGGTARRKISVDPLRSFVVLGPFEFPGGLHGAFAVSFYLPKGVPYPTGDPGHSAIYDFNTLRCKGLMCQGRGRR